MPLLRCSLRRCSPYFRALFKGGKRTRTAEATSSVVSAEALVTWAYEQPMSFEAFTWDDLAALMLDADYCAAAALQALVEHHLAALALASSAPLRTAELVPFSQGALVRSLHKWLGRANRFALEEANVGRLEKLDAFIRAVEERHALLSTAAATARTEP